jgi:hypothetical protein
VPWWRKTLLGRSPSVTLVVRLWRATIRRRGRMIRRFAHSEEGVPLPFDHPSPRRFPPPWTIEELNDACFVVSNHNGQALAYVYFEDEPGRRAAAKLLPRHASGTGATARERI